MLRQAIGGADYVVAFLRTALFIVGSLETLHDGVVSLLRMQQVVDGAFHRLIKFRERSVGKRSERTKDSANTFGIHDEWAHVVAGLGVGLEVRHIVAGPFLSGIVPPHLPAGRIKRFAIQIAGSAIV